MPEIYEMFFNLSELLRLIPRDNNEVSEKIEQFEAAISRDMAENRYRLFSDYGYESEFEKIH